MSPSSLLISAILTVIYILTAIVGASPPPPKIDSSSTTNTNSAKFISSFTHLAALSKTALPVGREVNLRRQVVSCDARKECRVAVVQMPMPGMKCAVM